MYNLVLTLTIRHSYGGLVYEALFMNPKIICKEEGYNVAIRHVITFSIIAPVLVTTTVITTITETTTATITQTFTVTETATATTAVGTVAETTMLQRLCCKRLRFRRKNILGDQWEMSHNYKRLLQTIHYAYSL